MKPQSAKAKGRKLQQWVRDQLIEHRDIHPEDIESRSMGAGGEDLIMARDARQKFPYSIECKNQEKLNVWDAYNQAQANSGNHEPIVIMTLILTLFIQIYDTRPNAAHIKVRIVTKVSHNKRANTNIWQNQAIQREFLLNSINFADPEDYIFFSDPDEIPKPELLINFELKNSEDLYLIRKIVKTFF